MTREEQLACLEDRPCSVCKFHTDRCNRWTCVFEDEPEEQGPCSDAISLKSVIEWLKTKDIIKLSSQEETARKELKALSSGKLQSCEDCISRKAVLELKTPVDTMIGWRGYMIDALDVEQLPSIQPKANTEVLDKIRAEISALMPPLGNWMYEEGHIVEQTACEVIADVLQIIDKYKAESEDKE